MLSHLLFSLVSGLSPGNVDSSRGNDTRQTYLANFALDHADFSLEPDDVQVWNTLWLWRARLQRVLSHWTLSTGRVWMHPCKCIQYL